MDPILAYYVLFWAAQKGLEIRKNGTCSSLLSCQALILSCVKGNTTPEVTKFILPIVDEIEKTKATLKLSETDPKEFVTERAFKAFLYADNQDRDGTRTKATANAFRTAALLFESLKQFTELPEEISNRMKYSVWRASHIMTKLNAGETPDAPPASTEEEELNMLSMQEPTANVNSEFRSDNNNNNNNMGMQGGGGGGGMNFPAVPGGNMGNMGNSSFPSVPSGSTGNAGNMGNSSFPSVPSGNNSSFPSVPSGSNSSFPSVPSGNNPSFPSAPSGNNPSFPSVPSGNNPSFPSVPSGNNPSFPSVPSGSTGNAGNMGNSSFPSVPSGNNSSFPSVPSGNNSSFPSAPSGNNPSFPSVPPGNMGQNHAQTSHSNGPNFNFPGNTMNNYSPSNSGNMNFANQGNSSYNVPSSDPNNLLQFPNPPSQNQNQNQNQLHGGGSDFFDLPSVPTSASGSTSQQPPPFEVLNPGKSDTKKNVNNFPAVNNAATRYLAKHQAPPNDDDSDDDDDDSAESAPPIPPRVFFSQQPQNFRPTMNGISSAQQHAKTAYSALNFDDVQTAVDSLCKSLKELTGMNYQLRPN